MNSINSSSADFGWTDNAGAASWEIEYGVSGFTQGTGTSLVVAANPYTLTGLSSATSYDVYIRAICAAEITSSALLGSFSHLYHAAIQQLFAMIITIRALRALL